MQATRLLLCVFCPWALMYTAPMTGRRAVVNVEPRRYVGSRSAAVKRTQRATSALSAQGGRARKLKSQAQTTETAQRGALPASSRASRGVLLGQLCADEAHQAWGAANVSTGAGR